MNRYALIVAGGSGIRMGANLPKQFLLLKGRPVLMHTIEAFAFSGDISIILVLPEKERSRWEELCKQYHFTIEHQIVPGGETRFHSVRNGLALVKDGLVAIHDGVRPLVEKRIIEDSYKTAEVIGNAVAAVKLKDSIREMMLTGGTKNVNRKNYYLVQTPQTFESAVIKKAYAEATHYNFTDDAGVLEENGGTIHIIEGSYRNIKITTSEDMLVAEALLA